MKQSLSGKKYIKGIAVFLFVTDKLNQAFLIITEDLNKHLSNLWFMIRLEQKWWYKFTIYVTSINNQLKVYMETRFKIPICTGKPALDRTSTVPNETELLTVGAAEEEDNEEGAWQKQ